jgi:hypothetical protein
MVTCQQSSRSFLVRVYQGPGIEIGALYNPVFVREGVQVKYVDWETADVMREQLRLVEEVKDAPLVNVDILEDGMTLASIAESSQEFIIANHFLEHVQDLSAPSKHLALLNTNGILFYGIPDKRYTFDKERPVTSLEHLVKDHEEGPAWSLLDHVKEYLALVEHKTGIEAEDRVKELAAQPKVSVHFHVWTIDEVTEIFTALRQRYQLPYVIEAIACNRPMVEAICVLRKV